MTSRLLLTAAGMGACIVVTGMSEVRLVSGAAAAVPLARTQAESETGLPSPPPRRLAEDMQPQAADDLPLKEERHPPPIVNYVPPKPKSKADDTSRKGKTSNKSDTKSKVKKAAASKSKAVHTKRKTK